MSSGCHQRPVMQQFVWDAPGMAGSDWLPAFLPQHHKPAQIPLGRCLPGSARATGSHQSCLWHWDKAAWQGSVCSCLAMDPETEQGLQNNNCQSPNGSCWFLQRRMGSRDVGNCWKVPAHPVRQPWVWLISANFCSHNVERLGGFVSLFKAFLDEIFLEPLLWNLQPWLYF